MIYTSSSITTMPESIITLSPEVGDLHRHHNDNGDGATSDAATAPQHDKAHPAKPILELSVTQDGRPYRSQVASNIDSSDNNDSHRQQPHSAAAASLGSSTDLPEAISEQDEETPSEGEPLTPSDSSLNIFQHHQQRHHQNQTGSSSPTGCGSSSLNGSIVHLDSNHGTGGSIKHDKPEAIHITPPDQDHQYSHHNHDDSSCYSPQQQQHRTPSVRSPRGSQFFSNPFSSSSSGLRQSSNGTPKPNRHSSFRSFFRRNSSALSNLHASEDVSGNSAHTSSSTLQPTAAADGPLPAISSPVSSVAAESAVSGSSAASGAAGTGTGSGTSPTESKFRFGLKRRQSPPTYADNNSTPNNSNSRNGQGASRGTSPTSASPSRPYLNASSQNYAPNDRSANVSTSANGAGATTPDADSSRKARHSHSHPSVHLGHLKERSKILFGNMPRPIVERRIRSPSVSEAGNQPPRPGFSIPAAAGVGLKARRMSASLPDDFNVDTCELDDEYVSASKLPGKRGKALGKGATATVKVMARRGHKKNDPLYAVKEFRKCGQREDKEEYIKKVKSEYSIAASLHHPNIVCTYNLCTHNGRFNHVMEHCQYGEIFSLVQKNYLGVQDNLCFFKQTVRGVGYLHANGIAHRDIKLENLLLTEEGHVKISDFGVSEVFCGIHPGLREAHGECGIGMKEIRLCQPGICGSMPYISPEVLAKQRMLPFVLFLLQSLVHKADSIFQMIMTLVPSMSGPVLS